MQQEVVQDYRHAMRADMQQELMEIRDMLQETTIET